MLKKRGSTKSQERPLIDNSNSNAERKKHISSIIEKLSRYLSQTRDERERKMIISQIHDLKGALAKIDSGKKEAIESKKQFQKLPQATPKNTMPGQAEAAKTLQKTIRPIQPSQARQKYSEYDFETDSSDKKKKPGDEFKLNRLERETMKRVKKAGKQEKKEKGLYEKKPNKYIQASSRLFNKYSMSLISKDKFKKIRRELIRGNLEFVPANYLSFTFFTVLLSVAAAFLIFVFFMFFSVIASPPFVVRTADSIGLRFLKVFWILFLVPAVTFMFLYFYPSMERKSLETRINHELPFATIHMSSISNSLVEPSKIFSIIVTTKEYPYLAKEFTKLLNEINIYGYDLVSALRSMAFNSPSKKLSELFNGLATTITSGGNLPEFFDKRSQTLLFEYRLEREKQSKAAETFMDIYISVVIAAPMILMLLLVMMRISGLGIALSTNMITVVMSLAVSVINVLFLTFLHLRQPEGG